MFPGATLQLVPMLVLTLGNPWFAFCHYKFVQPILEFCTVYTLLCFFFLNIMSLTFGMLLHVPIAIYIFLVIFSSLLYGACLEFLLLMAFMLFFFLSYIFLLPRGHTPQHNVIIFAFKLCFKDILKMRKATFYIYPHIYHFQFLCADPSFQIVIFLRPEELSFIFVIVQVWWGQFFSALSCLKNFNFFGVKYVFIGSTRLTVFFSPCCSFFTLKLLLHFLLTCIIS